MQGEIDLKRFKKLKRISKGSFGFVYQIQEKKTGEFYAAKIIDCDDKEDKCNEMVKREVSIMMYTKHPTIIKFIGYSKIDFHDENNVTIIMELAKNGSLKEILRQIQQSNGPKNYTNTTRQIILVGVARGIKYLHDRNIIHRDIKPENILLDENLQPHITDFGLSKFYDVGHSKSQTKFGGTLAYEAPEILKEQKYDKKVDVYAFSILMYEVLTDSVPYPELLSGEMSKYDFMSKIINNNYRPKFSVPIKDSLRELIQQCWSANPSDRPTFEEIFNKLANKTSVEDEEENYLLEDVSTDELDLYVEDVTMITDNTEKLINQISSLKEDNKQLKSEIQKLKEKDKKQSDTINSLEEDNKQLLNEIQKLKTENKRLSNKIIQIRSDKDIKNTTRIIKQSTFDKLDELCQNKVKSAELGEENDLVYVARGFIEGNNGFPQKVDLGIEFLKYGLKLKNVEAMQLYGSFLLNGIFVTKNEEKGISILYEAATLLNSTDMKLQLVNLLLSKQNFDVHSTDNNKANFPLAKKYCKEAADSGNTKAMVLYGNLCMKEKKNKHGEIHSDFKEALKYFKLAADNGDGEGMAHYGRFLEYGYGVEKPNKEEAFNYYQRSYKKDDMTGYTFYGSFLLEDVNGLAKNEEKGLRLVKYSCDQGNAYGMANYGYFLSKGLSRLPKDQKQSLHYYKMAADLGCPVAYSNLGVCYRKGEVIKKDIKLAIKYFKMAIDEGYPRSAFLLGNLLIKGDEETSFKPDIKEGYKYIKYAADHGIAIAMYILAYNMYYRNGIEMNANLIKKYLLNGIEYGHPDLDER